MEFDSHYNPLCKYNGQEIFMCSNDKREDYGL